ncbi:hypothetical protein Nepgr_016471 [Nepenthes gracilis]|uniref:Uncharacterized protein n=1 Tax=Nepenthes gracilis TaxID=150966 RepID=A0AAD3SMR0_NEPGR|nr:hypothetical protein Nepgr_016471 [Nepenthes gracilis]
MADLLGAHPGPRQVLNPSSEPIPLSSLEASAFSSVAPTLSSCPSSEGCTPLGSQIAPEVEPTGRILSSPSWADVVQRNELDGSTNSTKCARHRLTLAYTANRTRKQNIIPNRHYMPHQLCSVEKEAYFGRSSILQIQNPAQVAEDSSYPQGSKSSN